MVVPTVTTQAAGSITATGATLNGTMANKQGLAITAEGFEIGTTTGYSLGYFSAGTANLANGATFALAKGSLANFTLYHYRARCTNSTGNGFGGDQTFTTLAVIPTITMNAQSSASESPTQMHCYYFCSANGGQNPTTNGVCYVAGGGTPTIANSTSTIAFPGLSTQANVYVSGLTANTSYTFRAFGTNSAGTGYSGNQTRTTLNYYAPLVDIYGTTPLEFPSYGMVQVNTCLITDSGFGTIDDVGVVYARTSLNATPTVGGANCTKAQYATSDPGFWTQSVIGLLNNMGYSIRAYAHTSIAGYGYGTVLTFSTPVAPLVPMVYAVTSDNHSIQTYWIMNDNGGENPTGVSGMTLDTGTNQLRSTAAYHGDITFPGLGSPVLAINQGGLPSGTLHRTRAYSSNSAGAVYSADYNVSTTANLAIVTTTTASGITTTQAVLAGTVDNTYGSSIIESGVVYSTSANPTTADTKVGVGTGTSLIGTASGLTPKTVYHCRAYCITDMGTAYGSDQAFTTLSKVKKFNGKDYSSIKTFNGKPIAQVKTIQGVQ